MIYPDGYKSRCPKKVFEKAYIPIEQGDEITISDVKKFIEGSTFDVKEYGNRAMVHAVLPTEFNIVESSSCMSDSNHSQERRFEMCMQRIEKQVWEHLGFVLHWANYGLKRDK